MDKHRNAFTFQTESSFMTFEGLQIQGAVKIMEKLTVSREERCGMQLSVLLV
jgi:hypothetical protein